MGVMERVNKRQPPAPPEQTTAGTAVSQATQQQFAKNDTMGKIDASKVDLRPKEDLKGGVEWRSLDYNTAVGLNPELTRGDYISGVSQYRRDNNMPAMSYGEIYSTLGGKNPNLTDKQLQNRDRKLNTATWIDAIGNVMAHLVNYQRAVNGNPSMNLSNISQQGRIDKMRHYYDALDRSEYNSYLQQLQMERQRDAAAAAADRKYRNEMMLEQWKRNSPINLSKLKVEAERAKTEAARRREIDAKTEGQVLKNKLMPSESAARKGYYNARAAAAGHEKSSKQKQPKARLRDNKGGYSVDEYDLNKDKDVLQMYSQGVKMGLFPEYLEDTEDGKRIDISKLSPDKMRSIILYSDYYTTPDDDDYDMVDRMKKRGLGWGNNDNDDNKLDW